MINTHLKFEAKFQNGSKGVAFTRNYTKCSSFKANLTLKVNMKVTSFQTHLRHLDQCFEQLTAKKVEISLERSTTLKALGRKGFPLPSV